MLYSKTATVLGVLLTCGLLVSACQEDEQGRILRFEKGKYLGKPDTAITETTRRDLRQRALNQVN